MCGFSNTVVFPFFLIFFLFRNSALSEIADENFSKVLDNSSIIISLRDYNVTNPEGESIDSLYILPPRSMSEIIVTEVPDDVHFVVVQVHSYLVNVIVSLDDVPNQTNSITGTNVGLVKMYKKSNLSFYLTYNNTVEEASVMVSVQAYSRDAPVPGGCNMEFQVEVSPFLITTYDDVVTEVSFAPAAPPLSVLSDFVLLPSNECNIKPPPVQHKMYYHYLPERDFSKGTYFTALKSMMTKGRILKNGVQVPNKLTASPVKKIFTTYPGTGRAFAVISYFGNSSSVYVPSFTYGCTDLKDDNTCAVLTTTFSKLLCASILFIGLFICFFGHFFFRLQMFFFGCLAGGIVTYILTAISFSSTLALSTSVGVGLLSGTGLLITLTCMGLPLISIILATLTFGFLLASYVFYPITDFVDYFALDVNYWGVFVGIVTVCPVIMLCLAEKANIISSAAVGSFLGITSIDYYLGSNLRYGVLNVIWRAIDGRLKYAIIAPPFQANDIMLSALWIILTLTGKFVQKKLTKSKPPFPPPVNYFRRWKNSPRPSENFSSERTPLISERLSPGYTSSNHPSRYPFSRS